MNLSPSKYLLIRKIRYFVVVVVLILVVASGNLVKTGQFAISKLHFILKNPFLSYHEKMGLKWGREYDLLQFVKDNTPPGAVIAAPFRVRPWNILANGQLLPYFLYPRKDVKADRLKIRSDDSITHVMVAWGSWWGSPESLYGWPKFPVNIRKFSHLPAQRTISIERLRVAPNPLQDSIPDPALLLQNFISNSEKEVSYHETIRSSENRQVESIHLTYTFSSYDYWMKRVNVPLTTGMAVKGRVAAGIKRSVNLIAEVTYDNGKSAIFCSRPNEKVGHWEDLSIEDLDEKSGEYVRAQGWKIKRAWISGIGVNTGRPPGLPYLEKYGLIELEKGQNGLPESPDPEIETAPVSLARGNFLRVKGEIMPAIAAYQQAILLDPANAWIHCNLGDVYEYIAWFYFIKGKVDIQEKWARKAVGPYQKAIELEPDVAWFHYALGNVYKYIREVDDDLAIESLERSVELDASGVWAHLALGVLHHERKEDKEAYEHYKAASRFGKYNVYSKQALKALEYGRDRDF